MGWLQYSTYYKRKSVGLFIIIYICIHTLFLILPWVKRLVVVWILDYLCAVPLSTSYQRHDTQSNIQTPTNIMYRSERSSVGCSRSDTGSLKLNIFENH